MENKKGITPEEGLEKNPVLETVDISYYPGGIGNHVTVNGVNIGEVTEHVAFDIGNHDVPRIAIRVCPLRIIYKGQAKTVYEPIGIADIDERLALGMYEALRERFGERTSAPV